MVQVNILDLRIPSKIVQFSKKDWGCPTSNGEVPIKHVDFVLYTVLFQFDF